MGAVYWSGITLGGLFVGLCLIILGGPWEVLPGAVVIAWALGVAFFPKKLQRVKDIGGEHDNVDDDAPLVV